MAAPTAIDMQPVAGGGGGGDYMDGLMAYAQLIVKQRRKGWLIELCCNFEIENEYKVFDPATGNAQILEAIERSTCMQRMCCGTARQFEMSINTMQGQEIVWFDRPWHGRKGGCPCPCCFVDWCFNYLNVYGGSATARPRQRIGYVREDFSWIKPTFTIHYDDGNVAYRVVGDFCILCNYTLHVFDAQGNEVGEIRKQWGGMGRELFTDATTFCVTFPPAANATDRALLLGATFHIDFLYFERGNNNGGGGGLMM